MKSKSFMKNIKRKKIYLIGSFLVFIFFLLIFFYSSSKNNSNLIVSFFDIGQGDSALVILPNKETILIDGGPDNTVLERLGEALPFYRRDIDILSFSHYHQDHITGLIEVLKRYRVKRVIYAPSNFSSATLRVFLKTVQEKKIPTTLITARAHLDFFPNCSLYFINVDSLGIKPDQNNSLTLRLECQNKRFLFTGDNNYLVERALVNSDWSLKVNILKVGHHGSNSASTLEFLEAVDPDLAVISVGKNNRFGQPATSTIEHLKYLGIDFKRTDQEGTIQVIVPRKNR